MTVRNYSEDNDVRELFLACTSPSSLDGMYHVQLAQEVHSFKPVQPRPRSM